MPFIGTKTAPAQAEWQSSEPLDPAAWIPLVELALEGFGYADSFDARVNNLRHQLAEDVLLDDIGRACVPRSVARRMFSERAEKLRQEHADRDAQMLQAKLDGNPTRKRVRALQDLQSNVEPTGDALSDIKSADAEKGWERAAAIRTEMQSGAMVYRRIRDEEE